MVFIWWVLSLAVLVTFTIISFIKYDDIVLTIFIVSIFALRILEYIEIKSLHKELKDD